MILDGKNKTTCEQLEILEFILRKNINLMTILKILEEYEKENSKFKNWYVGAGGVNQTVFNYYHGKEIDYGIKDYDIVYFDSDTSYESEDVIIKDLEERLKDLNVSCDIKNQARVHIWYNPKYGVDRDAYVDVYDAISSWGSTVTCIACKLVDGKFEFYYPYGLDDLFNLTIRPVKRYFSKEQYEKKSNSWKERWENLNIIEW